MIIIFIIVTGTENKRLNRIEFKKIRNFYQMTIIFLRQRQRHRGKKGGRETGTEREREKER